MFFMRHLNTIIHLYEQMVAYFVSDFELNYCILYLFISLKCVFKFYDYHRIDDSWGMQVESHMTWSRAIYNSICINELNCWTYTIYSSSVTVLKLVLFRIRQDWSRSVYFSVIGRIIPNLFPANPINLDYSLDLRR